MSCESLSYYPGSTHAGETKINFVQHFLFWACTSGIVCFSLALGRLYKVPAVSSLDTQMAFIKFYMPAGEESSDCSCRGWDSFECCLHKKNAKVRNASLNSFIPELEVNVHLLSNLVLPCHFLVSGFSVPFFLLCVLFSFLFFPTVFLYAFPFDGVRC